MKKNLLKKGFTLIELLVVIAIIGILASVVLVSLNSARSKGSNTRILTEVVQTRTIFEQNYLGDSYVDIEGSSGNNIAALVSTSTGNSNLNLLLCDIGKITNYAEVPNDLVVTCDGVPGLHSSVVIYTNSTDYKVADYGTYALNVPTGYVCIDSYGNVVSTTTGAIPAYADITSTSTALCQ